MHCASRRTAARRCKNGALWRGACVQASLCMETFWGRVLDSNPQRARYTNRDLGPDVLKKIFEWQPPPPPVWPHLVVGLRGASHHTAPSANLICGEGVFPGMCGCCPSPTPLTWPSLIAGYSRLHWFLFCGKYFLKFPMRGQRAWPAQTGNV